MQLICGCPDPRYRPQENSSDGPQKIHAFFNRHFSPEGASYERVKLQSKRLHYWRGTLRIGHRIAQRLERSGSSE